MPVPDFALFGFADPTPRFVRVTTSEDRTGHALVDGVVVIPGLPVCRVRVRTDTDRLDVGGPGLVGLEAAVRNALHQDVIVELPWN